MSSTTRGRVIPAVDVAPCKTPTTSARVIAHTVPDISGHYMTTLLCLRQQFQVAISALINIVFAPIIR